MGGRLVEKQVIYSGKKVKLELHHLEDDETQTRHIREVVVHPGAGHAFMGPHNALGTFNAPLAAQIWPDVLSFLRETVR